MATAQPLMQPVSLAEFMDWLQRPENDGRRFELIDGEIQEVPSNPYSSWIVQKILAEIVIYLKTNPVGYVTGEAAGYLVDGQILAPDGAFTNVPPVAEGFAPQPPQLAIEVISSSDRNADVMNKLRKYSAAGVIVWVVYPAQRTVDVWEAGQPVISKGIDDTLSAPDLLPGLVIPLRLFLDDHPR